jgi:capsule biosynthesis phosphatase
MIVVILCGGSGTRMKDYSLPKPLNLIHGTPAIKYCLQNIPGEITELHFIVAPHLLEYNFEEIVINQFKDRRCIFHYLPYFTRGPIETAYLGIRDISDNGDNIVFLDNDVMYKFPDEFFTDKSSAFLGYAEDNSTSEAYSFLNVKDDRVIMYKEKKRISNHFCCGVYGFHTLTQFRQTAHEIITSCASTELYMSKIYEKFLENDVYIKGIFFPGTIKHLGSLDELYNSWDIIDKPKMRVCFDLDNTLVTNPVIPGDYSSVRPIGKMITLAQKMHNEGHTIIIHTARRMLTHRHNVGAAIRDIAGITLKTLDDFNIPYDEIIFGKPVADIYIDDRAVNPYRDSIQSMGYLSVKDATLPINALPPNRFNTVTIEKDKVVKKGPALSMQGEISYYKSITHDALKMFFPLYYGSLTENGVSTLVIENVKSIPFYSIYREGLVSQNHIAALFEFIDILHHTSSQASIPTVNDCMSNYSTKLLERFKQHEEYPFDDAADVQSLCLQRISHHTPIVTSFIHGDLWFSNILVTYDGNMKFIDMKGKVGDLEKTGGDIYYDYGKLLQSFLGYDAALYGHERPDNNLLDIFKVELEKRNILYTDVLNVTFSLVMGTLPFISSIDAKQRVWQWIKQVFI